MIFQIIAKCVIDGRLVDWIVGQGWKNTGSVTSH